MKLYPCRASSFIASLAEGCCGSVHFDEEELVFHGKVEFIRPLVSYEATNAKGLKKALNEAANDCLGTCEREGLQPEKPFKGNLNIRLEEELHRRLAIADSQLNTSLNGSIKQSLERTIDQDLQDSDDERNAA